MCERDELARMKGNLKMRVKIFNIKQEEEVFNKFAFMGTRMIGGKNKVDKNNYRLCGEGYIYGEGLDDVFYELNTSRPFWYEGHSLSVSDVVYLADQDKYFFCEPIGWTDVTSAFA